jgi:acylphosphatase
MSTQPPVALHAIVRGRVQGVGFREFVLREALSLGLTGYARNLSDGRSVEVVAEGRRDLLERLVEGLSEGPRGANVQDVETHWGRATGLYRDFDARL